jgi:hypothetical protein
MRTFEFLVIMGFESLSWPGPLAPVQRGGDNTISTTPALFLPPLVAVHAGELYAAPLYAVKTRFTLLLRGKSKCTSAYTYIQNAKHQG